MKNKRVLIAVIVTEVVTLISAGLIVFLIPSVLGWTGGLVCPSGTEVEVVQESAGTIPQLFCTGVDGQRSEDKFLPGLLVLYSVGFFLVFVVVLMWTMGMRESAGDIAVVPTLNLEGLDMETAVRQLMDRGRKIDAIKLVREQTGMGLKEAKLYVEALISGDGPLPVPFHQTVSTDTHADVVSEVRRLLSNGRKIEAIKYVREQTGMGLKEAKEYVESL